MAYEVETSKFFNFNIDINLDVRLLVRAGRIQTIVNVDELKQGIRWSVVWVKTLDFNLSHESIKSPSFCVSRSSNTDLGI